MGKVGNSVPTAVHQVPRSNEVIVNAKPPHVGHLRANENPCLYWTPVKQIYSTRYLSSL